MTGYTSSSGWVSGGFDTSYNGGMDAFVAKIITQMTCTWDGGGTDSKWSTAANWGGDITTQSRDNLVFPGGEAQAASVNDYPAGTKFGTISYTGGMAMVATPINATTVNVQAGQLTVAAIVADTLVIGAGGSIVIAPSVPPGGTAAVASVGWALPTDSSSGSLHCGCSRRAFRGGRRSLCLDARVAAARVPHAAVGEAHPTRLDDLAWLLAVERLASDHGAAWGSAGVRRRLGRRHVVVCPVPRSLRPGHAHTSKNRDRRSRLRTPYAPREG